MIIALLICVYVLIFCYIFARAENTYRAKDSVKATKKAYHFFNLWMTGLNIIIAYSIYATHLITVDDGRRDGGIMILALIFTFTILYQFFITMRFIFDIGGKIVDYFTERD
jgi:riboflavin transporter FmnP